MLSNIATLLAVSAGTIYGDYLIKLAAMNGQGLRSTQFVSGAVIYGLTAIGWLYMMRDHSLLKIGVLYSCSIIIMLAALGYFVFNERTEIRHVIGGLLAIISVIIMG